MTREKISLNDSVMDVVVKMSEGNPGAITVLIQMFNEKGEDCLLGILSLDDMNIRGSQIWVGFKDFAGEDIKKFIEAIKNRDKAMVDKINEVCSYYGEIAVCSGASYR